jgi:hypothetical protein
MIEKLTRYFETLEDLSTEELDRSVERLVCAEKRNVALVIAHIAEMSRRKGYLERGYKSLFEYCTRRLNLSEGSVARRMQVANVSRRFPQILVALAENRTYPHVSRPPRAPSHRAQCGPASCGLRRNDQARG